ncbi:MAG: threonine ammonia-lyase [Alphaproteobacteria bacterium]
MTVDLHDVQAAAARLRGQIAETPCVHSETLSRLTGSDVFLKFENLQFTASFKERGALNCLLQLTPAERSSGVIAMSAGNHAQALAYHGSRLAVPTTIVMPRSTPNAKVEQTRVFGAEVLLHGSQFDETRAFTEDLAAERGLTLVHPFNDPRVIAGQGTVGLEILRQVGEIDAVIVPVGGGGLIGGVAVAIKGLSPLVEVVGVQAERYAPVFQAFHGKPAPVTRPGTVAEGIAVKSPGDLTLPLIRQHVDRMLTVSEEQIEQAVFDLLEIEKTLVEGAGAAALAALRAQPALFRGRRVAILLSGGNIDMMILSSILQRGLVRTRRLIRLGVELQDMPGALAELTQVLGELDSNIIDIAHQRAFGGSSVRATQVSLVLQMRGEEQIERVVAALREKGYEVRLDI